MDTGLISQVGMSALDGLEDEFGGTAAGRVRLAAIVVEVDTEDGAEETQWRVFSSEGPGRRWLDRVILEMGLGQLDVEAAELVAPDDDEEAV